MNVLSAAGALITINAPFATGPQRGRPMLAAVVPDEATARLLAKQIRESAAQSSTPCTVKVLPRNIKADSLSLPVWCVIVRDKETTA